MQSRPRSSLLLQGRTSERQGADGQTKECAEIIIFLFFKKRQRKGGDGREAIRKERGKKKRWPGETGSAEELAGHSPSLARYLIPRTCMVKERTNFFKLFSDLRMHALACTHACTHTQAHT